MHLKLYLPTCVGCPHDLTYRSTVPQKKFGVMLYCGERYCTGGKRARRFKPRDPKVRVPAWCPRRKNPCEVRIYAPKSAEAWLAQHCVHNDDFCAPSAHRYAVRLEGTTELSPYAFWERRRQEDARDWFPFQMKNYDVLEIDDGLNPTYFYFAKGHFVAPCYFDGAKARVNVYEGEHEKAE